MTNSASNPLGFRPKAPGYWIRRYLPEQEAFVLAPADGQGSEIVASIDPHSPARGRIRELIMDSLFGNRQGLAPVGLLVRRPPAAPARPASGPELPLGSLATITDAFQTAGRRDAESRIVPGRGGQPSFRWTDSLADAVDRHGRIFLARRTVEFFARMNARPYGGICERAAASGHGAMEDPPKDFPAVLRGREAGRSRRYNPILPLRLQAGENPTRAQLTNFALQRALVETFASEAAAGLSALGEAQEELLSAGVLLAVPPERKPELLRMRTAEAARGMASLILAGLMDLHGAEPASEECDELFSPRADGSLARRPGLHEEILREMAPHPIAQSSDSAKKMAAYLELALSRLSRYEAEVRSLVSAEQAQAAPGAKPSPTTASPAQNGSVEIEPRGIDPWISAGGHAATAADHAHKFITQAETLPWI